MNSIFTDENHQDILNRINNLTDTTQAKWGKMDVGQMLKHCQLPIHIALEHTVMTTKANGFKKIVFKLFKPMMYNDKPWRPNMQTPKEFVVTDAQVFATEKENLITLLKTFNLKKENTNWPEHPLFGHFTTAQRGQMQYKHLDHHLKQFGV
jgi:hypothetical protein